jgi:hypothetical protein
MMKSIYDIVEETLGIERVITDLESGELTDEQATSILYDALISAEGDLKAKAEGYVIRMKKLEADAKIRSDEAKRLSESAGSLTKQSERLKSVLKMAMETLDTEKIETGLFTVAIQKNGGVAPVEIDPAIDTDALPEEFKKTVTTVSANKEAIRTALESGQELPFAKLGVRGTSLRVR